MTTTDRLASLVGPAAAANETALVRTHPCHRIPDRYEPGSDYPDRGDLAWFSGIDPVTRRIVHAVLLELASDTIDIRDSDELWKIIRRRAEILGAPR